MLPPNGDHFGTSVCFRFGPSVDPAGMASSVLTLSYATASLTAEIRPRFGRVSIVLNVSPSSLSQSLNFGSYCRLDQNDYDAINPFCTEGIRGRLLDEILVIGLSI